MKPERVHSVVAAGLAQPQLLARWLREPNLLRDYNIEPATLDLQTLWKFAGLITKVRHSCLRGDFPLTFRLLSVTGIEVDLFARYSLWHSSIPTWSTDTPSMKAQHMLNFIEASLAPDNWPYALLWDVMRHEHALMMLQGLPVGDEGGANGRFPSAKSVPLLSGNLILHAMRSKPREVAVELQRSSPVLESITHGSFYFGYWRPPSEIHIRVLELDELGFYLLSLADGERCSMELCRMLTGSGEQVAAILVALGDLGSLGILGFDTI